MTSDRAACGLLSEHLNTLGKHLDRYLRFEYPDAMREPANFLISVLHSRPPIRQLRDPFR